MLTTSGEISLGKDEVREFFELGWIIRRALFSLDEVARMRACFDELERIAGGLTETAMDHLLCQAHFKRPHDGVVFGWHQDIQHRDKGNGTWTDVNGRGSFVQTLIVLDEMTPNSGPLKFMPGSSKWGRVDFEDEACAELREGEAVTILAQPGDTLFFGPYTAHASFENKSDRYRRVLINGYASPGANRREYPGDGAGRRLEAPRSSVASR